MEGNKILIIVLLSVLAISLCLGLLNHKKQDKPYGLSISYENATTRLISWATEIELSHAVVEYVEKDQFKSWEDSNITTMKVKPIPIRDGEKVQYYSYKSELAHLLPATSYLYRVGEKGSEKWSESSILTTDNEKVSTFSFVHVTDSQGIDEINYKTWGRTLSLAIKYSQPRFIVHSGDLVEDSDYEQQWRWFFKYASALDTVPFMPTVGNHEYAAENTDAYRGHFNVPNNGLDGLSYYYIYGNTLMISLNTEEEIGAQSSWLEEILAEHATEKWTIVTMHRGMYGASRYKAIAEWEDIFDHYKVDLVLQGHNHLYARSYPMRERQIVSKEKDVVRAKSGTVYITLNAAGTKLNKVKNEKKYHAVLFQNELQMFGVVKVTPQTLTYEAYSVDQQLLDKIIISQ